MGKEKARCTGPNQVNELTVGYTRVSTYKQLDDGLSVEDQAERIRYYCAARDLGEPLIKTDAASGKNLDREEWERLFELVKQGRVRRLVVYRLDRMSRSLRDLIDLAEALQDAGTELHVIAENVSTDSASGRLFYHILGALAQWMRETIGENTRNVLAMKRARGEFTGGCVEYGYRKVGSGRLNRAGREIMLIEPDPAEQAVCELIHELRADGHGVTAIRRRLEAAGHRNRVGTPITCKQVYRVLARPQRCEAAESAA